MEWVHIHIEIAMVERRLTPLAFSLSREKTVSSRDHEKFLSSYTTMTSKGGSSSVASLIIQ